MARILVVEDNLTLTKTLVALLNRRHDVYAAVNMREARQKVKQFNFDLVLLDRQLPDGDGLELISYFADHGRRDIRTLVLSALGKTEDIITGFEEGGDDYLAKPFSMEELDARVWSLLNKEKKISSTTWRAGAMIYNTKTRIVQVGKQEMALTSKVGDLLLQFIRHPNQVMSREELIELLEMKADDKQKDSRALDGQVARLRRKLGKYGRNIRAIYKMGYQFRAPVA